ncbi:hypothetical protein DY000_02024047 [Brassica cretica]|uniref:Uncharacterized protein n=1 Tax=Brassica cretica TaxID=69181 RepID=A0ABQ7E1J4_BRACR|nr:hypothetical protein DY000_02024047 [Brassica cretica]
MTSERTTKQEKIKSQRFIVSFSPVHHTMRNGCSLFSPPLGRHEATGSLSLGRQHATGFASRRPGSISFGSPSGDRELVPPGRQQSTGTWPIRVASWRPRLGSCVYPAGDQDLDSLGRQQATETWSVRVVNKRPRLGQSGLEDNHEDREKMEYFHEEINSNQGQKKERTANLRGIYKRRQGERCK